MIDPQLNSQPLNVTAMRWLDRAKEPRDETKLAVVRLLVWGFHEGLKLPGPLGAIDGMRQKLQMSAERLLEPDVSPLKVMVFLLSNPNGPDSLQQEQELLGMLEGAASPQEAAQALMSWYADLKMATDQSYWRPATK
jgi:hypothetical protein